VGADRPFSLGIAGRARLDRCGHRPPGTRAEAPRRQRDPHHPHPPVLVRLLRAHIKKFGTTTDGRIFQTARGGILQDSSYNEIWDKARKTALTPAQYRSPLGRRPYDLRHAAVSLWLNSGVPATEVARRAGHGVAVLLKIYAHTIDGQAAAANDPHRRRTRHPGHRA
jgi:integrase